MLGKIGTHFAPFTTWSRITRASSSHVTASIGIILIPKITAVIIIRRTFNDFSIVKYVDTLDTLVASQAFCA